MISKRLWLGCSSFGIDFSRPSVYGMRMCANSVRVGAVSTIWPAYMTAMSSARPATTPRSWVTSTIAMSRSRCCCCSRLRICACTVTSSAVVGSSANSSFGPQASATAITMRWRMPPDIWCGYSLRRRSASGMPTDFISASAVESAWSRGMSRWYLSDSVICRPIFTTGLSEVIGSWKTIAISVPQYSRIAAGETVEISLPSSSDAALAHDVASGEQAHDRAREHRLARARLADDAERLAPIERERHAVDRLHEALGAS